MSLMEGTILGSNHFVGFANYKTVFLTNEFWQSLGNTVIYSLIVTPMIFIPAILCAVWLKRQSFSHSILRTVLFIPCAISLVASSYIWSWILNDTYGLLN
jgi:multiple sugar transport system permease protein